MRLRIFIIIVSLLAISSSTLLAQSNEYKIEQDSLTELIAKYEALNFKRDEMQENNINPPKNKVIQKSEPKNKVSLEYIGAKVRAAEYERYLKIYGEDIAKNANPNSLVSALTYSPDETTDGTTNEYNNIK